MRKKKIIILGATGNTGSYLTLYALNFFNKDEYEVIASGRRKTDFWTKQNVPYVQVDITKKEDLENSIVQKFLKELSEQLQAKDNA